MTAGALALATAVGTTLVGAWQTWAAQSREAQEVQQDLDDSTTRLRVSLGQLTDQIGRVTEAQAGAGRVADGATGNPRPIQCPDGGGGPGDPARGGHDGRP